MPLALRLTLSSLSLALAIFGLGLPNHIFQIYLTLWLGVLVYFRLEKRPTNSAEWLVMTIQLLTFCVFLKLLIGGGYRAPLFWLKYPALEWSKFQLLWQDSAFSEWRMDLTGIQSFLLVCTSLGCFLRLAGFASFTAALLLIFSLPCFLEFNWQYVLPALLTFTLSLACSPQFSLSPSTK